MLERLRLAEAAAVANIKKQTAMKPYCRLPLPEIFLLAVDSKDRISERLYLSQSVKNG
jgi:hypothetical protein